jgi:hypothetical protein
MTTDSMDVQDVRDKTRLDSECPEPTREHDQDPCPPLKSSPGTHESEQQPSDCDPRPLAPYISWGQC